MVNTKRRSVIKLAGSAAAIASTGMAGILASGRTPAFAQQKTVHWLKWVDFVPATDALLKKDMMPEAEKALGIKINFETVNANDLQPRITSAIQSGAGPDLIMLNNNHPQLYADSLVDLSDIAEATGNNTWRRVLPPMTELPPAEEQRMIADFRHWEAGLPRHWRSLYRVEDEPDPKVSAGRSS